MTNIEENLKKLSEPIKGIRWRVQSFKKTQKGLMALCIPYIDSRDVQQRLDDVLGIAGWQSRHKDVNGKLFCEIGVLIGDNWVWKSDVGSETTIEKEKGESSDSFKRAAVMWGIGRFLYSVKPKMIHATKANGKDKPAYPHKTTGELIAIWDNSILSKYINQL